MPSSSARPVIRGNPAPSRETIALADCLHSAAIHLLRRLRQADAGEGLSAPRLSALSVVVFAGPVTLGELASAEHVRPPTMTRLVQGLEADGLVRRAADREDGRLVRVHATAKGKTLLARARARRVAGLAAEMSMLTAAEAATLRRAAAIIERLAGRAHVHRRED